MVTIHRAPLISLTGNGLRPSRDLVRRVLYSTIDPCCEHPELRPLDAGAFLAQLASQRLPLLNAALTIWRYGRQHACQIPAGKPFGNYTRWASWIRDPLLALGCRDPVDRIFDLKTDDPKREETALFFAIWAEKHGETWIKAADLDPEIKAISDPKGSGANAINAYLKQKVGSSPLRAECL